mmetsp:Transcript_73611/g.129757  ORF Transcript_73611/g.129757 Transcript_73611/m.129757 type:complete len:85 (-) Transcript_73611:9-263(-)
MCTPWYGSKDDGTKEELVDGAFGETASCTSMALPSSLWLDVSDPFEKVREQATTEAWSAAVRASLTPVLTSIFEFMQDAQNRLQ